MHNSYSPLEIGAAEDNGTGEVITFYSYKGGTGRTMALVNIAVLLGDSRSGNSNVLAVDWDLEAPGLHKYFAQRCEQFSNEHNLTPSKIDMFPGLIDLWYRLMELTASLPDQMEEPDVAILEDLEAKLNLSDFIIPTDIPNVSYIKAGRFNAEYESRVSNFPWRDMFARQPWMSGFLARVFASRFRFTLIDSRTGVTDTAGICTALLPNKLVLVFTPNKQSLDGVLEVGKKVLEYRRASKDDLRALGVFPLPSRIDKSEGEEFMTWRKGDEGYQKGFERLFKTAYSLDLCDLETYFDEVQVPHSSWYSYGEKIAVIDDTTNNRLSLKRSFITFENILLKFQSPWSLSEEDSVSVGTSSKQAWLTLASFSEDKRLRAKAILMRMLLVGVNGENAPRRVRAEEIGDPIVKDLIAGQVIRKEVGGITLKTDFLVIHPEFFSSPLLQKWLNDDLDFLLWRQKLDEAVKAWELSNFKNSFLLRGRDLKGAKSWRASRLADLTQQERDFITRSLGRLTQIVRRASVSCATFLAILLGGVVLAKSDWAQYERVFWHPPSVAPLLDEKGTRFSASLATAMNEQVVTSEQIVREWFLALGRAGRVSEGVIEANNLPVSTRSIALSALAKGEGTEASPMWDKAIDVADQNGPNESPRLNALINMDRDRLDDAISAADSIRDVKTRNEVYANIVMMLVQRHENFEARRVARHFSDFRPDGAKIEIDTKNKIINDPLVALYSQIYLAGAGLPSARYFPGDNEVGWGMDKEPRYQASSSEVKDFVHLQMKLSVIRSSLHSSSNVVVDPKDMPAKPAYQAAVYLEQIRVSGMAGDYEHAVTVYHELLAAANSGLNISIADVPLYSGFLEIDRKLSVIDVAKSFINAACELAQPLTICGVPDFRSGSGRNLASIKLISELEIVNGLLFQAETENSLTDLDKAYKHTESISNPLVKSYLLSNISIGYSKARQFARAREAADQCTVLQDKVRALAKLIVNYRS
jgi:MinD-like ATPase involved in chromosome partitioning or flagellar assembly